MASRIKKEKIDKLLNKKNSQLYNIVQLHDGVYYVTDGCCIWIDHNAEFFEQERSLYLGKEYETNVESMRNHFIERFLENDEYDYKKVQKKEKITLERNGHNIKAVSLEYDGYFQLIDEKYYNTFDNRKCNYLICKNALVVFVTDEEGLLIGIIAGLIHD